MEYINDDRFRVFGIFRPNQSRVSPGGERRYCPSIMSPLIITLTLRSDRIISRDIPFPSGDLLNLNSMDVDNYGSDVSDYGWLIRISYL